MAIDAKVSFLGKAEEMLSTKLTASDMRVCLGILSDILGTYSMQEQQTIIGMDDMLDSFVSSMQIQGKSQKTIDRYVYIINRFSAFIKVGARSVNVYHIRNWLASEKARGIADSTLEGNRQVLSSYFGWLHREGLIEKNPIANVGTIKVLKKKRETITSVEFAKIDKKCETLRDRAILHFLSSTGCRVSEMVGLNRDSIDLNRLECIVHGKGNKERKVFLSDVAGMLIGQYLAERRDACPALFIGKGTDRLLPGGVRIMLNRVAKAAGVEHVHPHKFRRTLATDLARRRMPIQEIKHILGHEKIDTTMGYVNVDEEDVKYDYRRCA